ncbi:LegC family aminotransferase [Paenibacillus wynnii]|uniref:LegC family aminotransferase n=1 Tax=Paenibacillus wynnii TaxID=268407 RepID=UPI00278DAFCF|nr:LegC family aminotransferase [Paenibacillus wynnii]MDQ0194830.1 perosamine synthetase [Paenibacillus wynnii]
MNRNQEIDSIIEALQQFFPVKNKPYPLHEPLFAGNEWEYLKECLNTNWVSSAGPFVDQFEQHLITYTGIKHAVAVVNGTAALHICLLLAGVEPGDEVLIPSLTFVATANAVRYCGAVPHFVDNERTTLGLDPYKLGDYLKEITEVKVRGCFNKQTGRRIKALLPMHTFGHPVDIEPLEQLSIQYQLALVEDAAESLGSYYKGRHTGSWGMAAAVSFNGNKVITTGGGGAILTNDPKMAQMAKHLTTTAKLPHRWAFEHDQVGYNYRLPNINAALGCAQMEQIEERIEQKRNLANQYSTAFKQIKAVQWFAEPASARSNYWLNVLLLDNSFETRRDEILDALHNHGYLARPAWRLLHSLKPYLHCPRSDLTVAEQLERQIITLPSTPVQGGSHE